MNKLHLLFVILSFLTILGSLKGSAIEITKHKNFWITPLNQVDKEGGNQYQICFRGLHPSTTFILLIDDSIENLSAVISTSASNIKFGLMGISTTIPISIGFSEDINMIDLDIHNYVVSEVQDYCITFTSLEGISSIKNLKIIAASSPKANRIEYAIITNYSTFNFYGLTNTPGLEITSSTPSVNTATLSDSFSLTVAFSVNTSQYKRILTKENTIIRITMNNVDFGSTSIESTAVDATVDLTDKLDAFTADIKSTQIVLSNISEDLIRDRDFKLVFSSLKLKGITTGCPNSDTYTITAEVLWKNTNSVISRSNYTLGISCEMYKIQNPRVRHTGNFPALYSGASFPLEITFSVSEQVTNGQVVINSGAFIEFLGATCVVPTGNRCYSVKDTKYTRLVIDKFTVSKNAVFTIRVWVSLSRVSGENKYSPSTDSTKILIKVTNFTSDFTVTSKPLFTDSDDDYTEDGDGECTGASTPTGCVYINVVKENSSNFYLINSNATPEAAAGLSTLNNSPFEIKFGEYIWKTGGKPLKTDWVVERLIKTGTDNHTGTHRFYLPPNYTKIDSLTSQKAIYWKSTFSCDTTPNTLTFNSYTVESNQNSRAKNIAIGTTINTTDSIISISNNNVGIFYNTNFEINESGPVLADCDNFDATLVNNDSVVSHSLKFSNVKFATKDVNNIYEAFDFIHAFFPTYKESLPVRVNRFVSLLPQNNIFYKEARLTANSFVTKLYTLDSVTTNRHVCILELDLSAVTVSSTNTFSMIGSPINYLDFEDMSSYPVSGNLTARAGNSYIKANKIGESSNYDYNLFLLNRLEITLSKDTTTVVVPVRCDSYEYEIDESPYYHVIFNTMHKQNTNYAQRSYLHDIIRITPTNLVSKDGKIKFGFKNDKFNINVSSGTASTDEYDNEAATKTNRFVTILSNYELNISSIKILNQDFNEDAVIFPSSSNTNSISFSSLGINTLSVNSSTFKYTYVIYRLSDAAADFYLPFADVNKKINLNMIGPKYPAETAQLAVQSKDFQVFFNSNDKDVGGELENIIRADTIDTDFNGSQRVAINTLVASLKVLTTGIKTPVSSDAAKRYICGEISINLKSNINIVVVTFENNVLTESIAEAVNFTGTLSVVSGVVTITITEARENKIVFDVCNIQVSADSNPLKISSVEQKAGDKSLYRSNDAEVVTDSPTINANDYLPNVVTSFSYSTNRTTYTSLFLRVDLDHEAYRNMRLEIKSSILSSLKIDDNLVTRCEPRFQSSTDVTKNKIFESCVLDLTSGSIVIKTHNKIMFSNLPKNLEIQIWPVKAVKLSDSDFEVVTSFGIDTTSIFPTILKKPSASTSVDVTNIPCIINPLITSITPNIPGFRGKITITIDETANTTLSECLNNFSNPVLNEILIYLPPSSYGVINTNNLECRLNNSIVSNCVMEDEWILIRASITTTEINTIDISGYIIVTSDFIPATVNSKFLVKLNTLTSSTTTTWVNGIGKITENFDRTSFVYPSTSDTKNLATIQHSFTNTSPNSVTSAELHFAIDDLTGLNSSTDLSLASVVNAMIYVQIPSNMRFTATSDVKLQHVTVAADSDSSREDITFDYALSDVTMYGTLISAKVTSEVSLNSQFKRFILTITNLEAPWSNVRNENERAGLFDFAFVKANFYLRTLPTLLTYDTTTALAEPVYGFIKNQRGINFAFKTGKFYLDYTNNFNITPGVYNSLEVNVRQVGTVDDLTRETILSIANAGVFYTPKDSKYTVNGQFKSKVVMMIGANCDTIPGMYFIRLQNSDSNSQYYERMPPLRIMIRYSYVKESIRFFDGNMVEYKAATPFSVPIEGFSQFFVRAINPSVTNLTVKFSRDLSTATTTTVTAPENMTIMAASSDFVINKFSSPDPKVTTKQRYLVTVEGNNCFTFSNSAVEFIPNITLEAVDPKLDIASIISFQTANSSATGTLLRNQIRMTFDGKQVNIPAGSQLFCSLYCADRTPPSEAVLTKLPLAPKQWYETTVFAQLSPNTLYSFVFDNLVRDQEYNLKCLIRSGHVNTTRQTKKSVVLTMFDQEPIQPKKTDLLTCFELVVQEKTEKFDQEAQKIVQNQFFEKFEERGCVVVLNEQGDPITNFEFIDYPCEIRPASDQEGGEDEDTETAVSSDTEATATSVASRVNSNRLRFLQTTTTTATDTTTTESTETTTETLTTGFTYCLAQSRICPNDAIKTNTNTGVNDVLNTLFVSNTKSTTTGSTDNTLFKTKLSKEVTNNYIGFRKIDPDTSFELDSTAFTANDYSDYQIKSTKVKISFDIKNNKSESLACYFGLSDIPKGSETPPTTEDIMSCKSGVMAQNLCSTQLLDVAGVDKDGWALFTANEKTVIEFNTLQGNLVNGKTYYLWMTCRQNLVIARKYSTPLSVLSTNAALIPEKTTPACATMATCTLACTKTSGNNFWPTCCGTAGIDSTNPNICAAVAGYLKSLGLMIAVLFLFLF